MALPKSRKNILTKKFLLFLGIMILVCITLVVLEKTRVINLFEKKPTADETTDKTTSDQPTAQEDFTDGNERDVGNSIGENEGSGVVEDRQGQSTETTNSNLWSTSASGEIVVHSPYKNQGIASGKEISGTSSLPKVSYRLIDSVSGEIAQGELSVINGKYAGVLNFTTTASEGRLDIFGTKPDGSEFSNVEIPIEFN